MTSLKKISDIVSRTGILQACQVSECAQSFQMCVSVIHLNLACSIDRSIGSFGFCLTEDMHTASRPIAHFDICLLHHSLAPRLALDSSCDSDVQLCRQSDGVGRAED